MPRAESDFEPTPASVGAARKWVRETLSNWAAADFEWAAVTLTSELATNAVLHARTEFRVTLVLSPSTLRIEVADGSPIVPVKRRFGTDSTTGRGMRLVDELATSWRVDVSNDGKVIACEVPIEAPDAVRDPMRGRGADAMGTVVAIDEGSGDGRHAPSAEARAA